MSVIKSKRGLSGVQFLDTARELHLFTLRTCAKFPKRYTFFITNNIIQSASLIHGYVKRGNSIFPSCPENKKMRYEQFVMAGAELQNLISQINIAYEIFPIADKVMTKWMQLINSEIGLLRALVKKEKQ